MYERFTDRSRRVVTLAQEEARLLGHNYIGTEHILLGLVHEGEGVAAKALESLGISLVAVRGQVEGLDGQGDSPVGGHIPFTPRAKRVLEFSLREALQLGHNYIGTEHILLGLLREGEGVAAKALANLGLDLSEVRLEVIRQLTGSGTSPATGEPEDPDPELTSGQQASLRLRNDLTAAALTGKMVPKARLTAVQLMVDAAITQIAAGDVELALETLRIARIRSV